MFDLSDVKKPSAPKKHQLIGFIPLNDAGAVWSLKWSPACSSPAAYLAAGTSSGAIYVFKIFSEHIASAPAASDKAFPFYRTSKSIRCVLHQTNERAQCLALDWSVHDPNRLAASYSHGFIALFHVNTTVKHLIEPVASGPVSSCSHVHFRHSGIETREDHLSYSADPCFANTHS